MAVAGRMRRKETLATARRRLAGAVGAAARMVWRRDDLTCKDEAVLALLCEALVRVGELVRPRALDLGDAPGHVQQLFGRLAALAQRPAQKKGDKDALLETNHENEEAPISPVEGTLELPCKGPSSVQYTTQKISENRLSECSTAAEHKQEISEDRSLVRIGVAEYKNLKKLLASLVARQQLAGWRPTKAELVDLFLEGAGGHINIQSEAELTKWETKAGLVVTRLIDVEKVLVAGADGGLEIGDQWLQSNDRLATFESLSVMDQLAQQKADAAGKVNLGDG